MAKHWCFTINNYTDDDIAALDVLPCIYMIIGFEIGDEETPHLQGYVEFEKNVRFNRCKTLLGGRAHIESRKGSREQARDYCKKDGDFVEFGEWIPPQQGKRNDLEDLMAVIRVEKDTLVQMEAMPKTYSKHIKMVDRYRAEIEKRSTRDFRKVECHIFWGAAGSGKSRRVRELTNNTVFRVNTANRDFMFNGYDGEESILFDDFYGEVRYSDLLDIMDGYQQQVNVKYGHRYAQWTTVYFTSNKHPDSWYQNLFARGITDSPALLRRITSITEMTGGYVIPSITEVTTPVTEVVPVIEVAGNTDSHSNITIDRADNIMDLDEIKVNIIDDYVPDEEHNIENIFINYVFASEL